MSSQEKIIVLRTIRHGESDLVVHGLASNGSKLCFFARAALKSKKRFGGGVFEPTHYIQVEFKPPKGEEGLNLLLEAQLLQSFPKLRTDYDRLETALFFISLVDRVSKEGDLHSEGLFNLLGHALKASEVTSKLHLLRLHFQTKFLAHQGVLSDIPFSKIFLTTKLQDHEEILLSEDESLGVSLQVRSLLSDYVD